MFMAVLVFLSYSNTLKSPFILDDGKNIVTNRHIRLTRLSLNCLIKAGVKSPLSKRVIPNMSFALNYYVHQYNVQGYHIVNLMIHVINGFLLYLFLRITLGLPSLSYINGGQTWIPLLTAFIWLVHPVQTQSVTYVVQRMNSMATLFYLLALLLYVKARLVEGKKKWFLGGACIVSGVLALSSKETSATLPFFILVYEWYFFQDLSMSWVKGHRDHILVLCLILLVIVWVYLGPHPNVLAGYDSRDFTLSQRLLTETRVIIFYISLLLFPHPSRLNLEHDFPLSHSLLDPMTTLGSLMIIVGLLALAIHLARRDRMLSYCILWFLGNLVIESSIIPLEIIFEHRIYLPSMMVILLGVVLAFRYLRPKWMTVTLLFTIVMLLTVWTHTRNNAWRDDLSLWKDCVEKSPGKARPHNGLGLALANRGRLIEAIDQYGKAVRLDPDDRSARNNIGLVLVQQGRFEEAIAHFRELVQSKPKYPTAHSNLGYALLQQGRSAEAIECFTEALFLDPYFKHAHSNMGIALAARGRFDEAIRHYEDALRIDPDFGYAHLNLGVILAQQRQFDEAVNHFSAAIRINPDLVEPYNRIGLALVGQGKIEEAILHFEEAIRLAPNNADAHNNLGVALMNRGRTEAATDQFRETLRLNANHADAHNNLGVALIREGGADEAIHHFQEALRLRPDDTRTQKNLSRALTMRNTDRSE